MPNDPIVVIDTPGLLARLKTTEQELSRIRSPRVHLERDAVLALVRLCYQCIEQLSKVH